MQNYTNHIENYPIKKEDFIQNYVLVKGKYIVRLAGGQKISIPETDKQKNILDKKLLNQINCITEEDLKNLKNKLKNRLNIHRLSFASLIIAIVTLLIANKTIVFGANIFSLLSFSTIITYILYLKTKYIYEDVIKNKTIVKDSELINSLLQVKNIIVRKDLASLFKGSKKKVVKKFIKENEKASINSLDALSLKELLSLKKAALKYKHFIATYDNYENFSKDDNRKIKFKSTNN